MSNQTMKDEKRARRTAARMTFQEAARGVNWADLLTPGMTPEYASVVKGVPRAQAKQTLDFLRRDRDPAVLMADVYAKATASGYPLDSLRANGMAGVPWQEIGYDDDPDCDPSSPYFGASGVILA